MRPLKDCVIEKNHMDLIRSGVRPQTPLSSPLPASPASEPEGTGTLGLGREQEKMQQPLSLGMVVPPAIISMGPSGLLCHSRPASGSSLLPTWGMAARRGHKLSPGKELGCSQGERVWEVRERRTVGLKMKLNEKRIGRVEKMPSCTHPEVLGEPS